MQVQTISDFHFGHVGHYEYLLDNFYPVCDTLIIAGDFSIYNSKYTKHVNDIAKAKRNILTRWKTVIIVPGNHDYYYGNVRPQTNLKKLYNFRKHEKIDNTDIYTLNNDFIDLEDVRFICSTMWSPIYKNVKYIYKYFTDYEFIEGYDININNEVHKCSMDYMSKMLDKSDKKNVIVTHHVPLMNFIHPKYANDSCTECFCANVGGFINEHCDKINTWIFGHTHNYYNQKLGDINFVCNPFGYMRKNENKECNLKLSLII